MESEQSIRENVIDHVAPAVKAISRAVGARRWCSITVLKERYFAITNTSCVIVDRFQSTSQ